MPTAHASSSGCARLRARQWAPVPVSTLWGSLPCPGAGFPTLDPSNTGKHSCPAPGKLWCWASCTPWGSGEHPSLSPSPQAAWGRDLYPMPLLRVIAPRLWAQHAALLTSCHLLHQLDMILSKSAAVLPATSPCRQPAQPGPSPCSGPPALPHVPVQAQQECHLSGPGMASTCKSSRNQGLGHMGSA